MLVGERNKTLLIRVRNGLKRTLSNSGVLRPLQMMLEESANKDLGS